MYKLLKVVDGVKIQMLKDSICGHCFVFKNGAFRHFIDIKEAENWIKGGV